MKQVFLTLIFISFQISLFGQTLKEKPLSDEEEERLENFAEQMMESFDFENLQEQMHELAEKMKASPNSFGFGHQLWSDSLKNGMSLDNDFFEQLQRQLSPMMDSMLSNGNMYHNFNFGDMQNFDFNGLNMEQLMEGMPFDIENFKDMNFGSDNFTETFKRELWADGLFDESKSNKFELTNDYLKINGQKQSKDIFKKYRNLYEDVQEHKIGDDFTLQLNFGSEKPKKKTRRI